MTGSRVLQTSHRQHNENRWPHLLHLWALTGTRFLQCFFTYLFPRTNTYYKLWDVADKLLVGGIWLWSAEHRARFDWMLNSEFHQSILHHETEQWCTQKGKKRRKIQRKGRDRKYKEREATEFLQNTGQRGDTGHNRAFVCCKAFTVEQNDTT